MGSCQGGHQSRPGLDDLGVQRRKGGLKHLLGCLGLVQSG
jgi:hypothetical protein